MDTLPPAKVNNRTYPLFSPFSPPTISRELRRKATNGVYLAAQAQQASERRRRERPLVRKVLWHCPNVEWRLIVALARFGGLRTPNETLALRWCDVDWAGQRFAVHGSKTEHHDGAGVRIVPNFPELRPNSSQFGRFQVS